MRLDSLHMKPMENILTQWIPIYGTIKVRQTLTIKRIKQYEEKDNQAYQSFFVRSQLKTNEV